MKDKTLPTVRDVEIVGTQPKPADLRRMEFIASNDNVVIRPVTYLVKLELDDHQAAMTGQGFSLYVGDQRIEKYSGYRDGIYFKVNDPRFFDRHAGEQICLSWDDETFVETGRTLPSEPEPVVSPFDALGATEHRLPSLPTQEEALQAEREPQGEDSPM